MTEDSVTLEFFLSEPMVFIIGDYINDELFGKFYITEEVAPPDTSTHGTYKYSIRFDRDYYIFRNKVFCLTYYDKTLGLIRKETTWTLTDTLTVHIKEIIRNLYALGYVRQGGVSYLTYSSFKFCIDGQNENVLTHYSSGTITWTSHPLAVNKRFSGVADRESMATITYDGTNIIEALNTLAKTYNCEWWVRDDTFCLGKCEYNDSLDFRIDKDTASDVINVESMSINRNEREYANRLYVFGSTKNIPYTYRKKLEFTADKVDNLKQYKSFTGTYSLSVANTRLTMTSAQGYQSTGFIPVQRGDVVYLQAGCQRLSGKVCLVGLSGIPASISDVGNYAAYVLAGYDDANNPTPVPFTIDRGDIACVIASSAITPTCYVTTPNIKVYSDSTRQLLRRYFNVSTEEYPVPIDVFIGNGFVSLVSIGSTGRYRIRGTIYYSLNFNMSVPAPPNGVYSTPVIRVDSTVLVQGAERGLYAGGNTLVSSSISIDTEVDLTAGNHNFYLEFNLRIVKDGLALEGSGHSTRSDIITSLSGGERIISAISYPGYSNVGVAFNPQGNDNYSEFSFVNGSGQYIVPPGFSQNTVFTIRRATENEVGIIIFDIPDSFYTSELGDLNANRILGERRLMLPEGVDYIGDDLPKEQVVEKVVIFDDVYPKCALRIVGLHAEYGKIKTGTYPDGTPIYADGVNYFIAVKRITPNGDVDFPFNADGVDMRIDGEPLQIKFLTKDEARQYGNVPLDYGSYMLSGLTFDVGINESGSLIEFVDDETGDTVSGFQIARTNEYKTSLPNEVMKPTVGDALILTGWNTNYMETLGLIGSAEQQLLALGNQYKDLLEFDLFTFENRMMSDWAARTGILDFGQRVKIYNKGLTQDGLKESRVIGYELKFDIPEDSPAYTVGETEAYSRLKALERELNAQTRSATSSGTISGSGGSDPGDLSNYWQNADSSSAGNYLVEATLGTASDAPSTAANASLYAMLNYYFPIS